MSEAIEDELFNSPIVIPESIYSDAQSIETLAHLKTWAQSTYNMHQNHAAALQNVFEADHLSAFGEPFAQIVDTVTKFIDPKIKSKRSLNTLAKGFQKQLDKTLVGGTTFATPSRLDKVANIYPRNTNYLAGLYSMLYNLPWVLPIKNYRNVINQAHFQQGVHSAQYFGSHKQGITPSQRKLDADFVKMEADMEGIVEDAQQKLMQANALLDSVSDRLDADSERRIVVGDSVDKAIRNRLRQGTRYRRTYLEKIDEIESLHEQKLKSIREAFSSEIALSAPAEHWKTRAKDSRTAAIWFGILFIAMSSLFIYLAFNQGPELYGEMTDKAGDKGLSLAAVAVFTFPVVVGLWMLKSAARLFVENLHVHQDASYRRMIITTYLSMLRDPQNPITPQEREHALKAIFSSNPGKAEPISLPTDRLLHSG